jgi:Protein of unknown function (DUF642)
MKSYLRAAVALATTLAASASFAANLVQDGGFETPDIGDAWYQTFTSPFPIPVDSWNPSNVDIVSSLGAPGNAPADQGLQYLDLVGTGLDGTELSTGMISQTFGTVAGQTYTLSFAYANNPWSTSTASASVSVDGLSGSVTHDTSTTTDLNWLIYTNMFVATSSSATLTFMETVGANNGGVLLDAVSVTGVPEASTWAMMLAGFAGLSVLGYRARRGSTLAA